ncbi:MULTISPECIES: TDT family transporter [unclassified Pseudomonas]|jgi:C4-dicarboxylate transporter/malic acid transport protein|uniref:TDT family transporter n=1 Tax=unclassified Pseudomonas TaxID=196821 RepID=UPI00029D1E47|nr:MULTISPECIES: TDT family transporter [unclassified Pseudomonas]AFY20945.1 C4-dicarboxylate transporter/malic acid transport protein [Pseudomonas sp. UW4]PBJ10744.1 C4-dicarboxylate transporter/malic acid transport protein [Pseudomonas sp. ACN5]PMZ78341.1 C4-dicarboxylate transporter/malic acid transporter [Pseudomonas sp. FW305-70]
MTCANSIKPGIKPFSHLQHPREVIRQFTPNWFAATMGTGVLALALAQLPVAMPALRAFAEALWLFNIALFLLFTALYAARWLLFFDEARRIFGHSTVSMFFGTIPMGLATIINGFLVFGLPRWGDGVIHLAEVLWWLDVAMSLACGVLIPYMMFTRQEHSIDQMTAVWLLPVVAAEVAAASGGLLAPHLADAHSQLVVLVTSYVLWAFSLPVAFSILTILLLRMALHKLPHENMAASSWLALGPIGTGALGMLVLGGDAPLIFAANGLPGVGEIAAGLGLVAGITLWGLGLWWMLMALLITVRYLRAGIPFNLGWWGFTFPLGVYSLATLKLASTLNLTFFSVSGCVLVALLAVMWLIVGKRTVLGAWRGELFVSPCIAGLKK